MNLGGAELPELGPCPTSTSGGLAWTVGVGMVGMASQSRSLGFQLSCVLAVWLCQTMHHL